MKNKRRIIGIVAATILAIVGTVALVGYVQSAKNKAVASEALVDVYVVDQLVPKGAEAETIKSSVSVEQIPARLEQPGAITDLDDVGANVAATDLQPGDQLLAARLVAQDEVAVDVKDKVQIATPVLAPERIVGGGLKTGDLVGVYLSFDTMNPPEAGPSLGAMSPTDASAMAGAPSVTPRSPDGSTPDMTRLEFQHVLVTNVQTVDEPIVSDNSETNETGQKTVEQVSGQQYIVTLALSPEQSERFVFATEFGHVWLSNQPATVSDDGTRLVTVDNVYSVVK